MIYTYFVSFAYRQQILAMGMEFGNALTELEEPLENIESIRKLQNHLKDHHENTGLKTEIFKIVSFQLLKTEP